MSQTVRKFIQAALGYGLASILTSLLAFLLLPLYTQLLSPADYGVIDVVATVTTLLVTLVVFGVDHALQAFFFDGDAAYHQRLSGTVLWTTLSFAFVVWGAQIMLAPLLAQALFAQPSYAVFFYLSSMQVLVAPLVLVLTAIYRLRVRVLHVNLIGLLTVVSVIAGNLIFVGLLGYGILGVALATGVTYSVVLFCLLLFAHADLRLPFDRSLLRPIYGAAVGVLPATLSWLLILNIDRVLLTQFVSLDDLGRYSLASKIATMLYVGFTIIWGAWVPLALAMAREPQAPQHYARVFELFSVGAMGVALGLGLFTPEILSLISRADFQAAAPYALVLMAFTGPLTFMSACFNLPFYIAKRTYLLSVVNISAALVNIGLNLLLDPLIGIWGAVLATIAAGLVMISVGYLLGRRLITIPYRWLRLAPALAAYSAIVAAFAFLPGLHSMLKIAALSLFGAVVFGSGILSPQLIRQGLALLRVRPSVG